MGGTPVGSDINMYLPRAYETEDEDNCWRVGFAGGLYRRDDWGFAALSANTVQPSLRTNPHDSGEPPIFEKNDSSKYPGARTSSMASSEKHR